VTNRTEQAYEVTCPKCKQPKGHHCLYAYPADVDRATPSMYLTSHQRKQMLRAGQPTKVPHQERFHAWDHTIGRRFQREIYENAHPVHHASDETRAAHKAMVMWDLAEYHHLRTWLMRYGQILGRV
jgi:pyrroloquinoline quinone (PQQ) biosynthesis protein C